MHGDLETALARILRAFDQGNPEADLSLCRAYNAFASSVACVPATHPAIGQLRPSTDPRKYNLHIWIAHLGDQTVIVRSYLEPASLFSAETVRVRFGYYPQNPRARAASLYAARLNVFLLEPGPTEPVHGGDGLLVWQQAVCRGIIGDISVDEVPDDPPGADARVRALRVASERHHSLMDPVQEACRMRRLPPDPESWTPGIRILSELPHVALWDL